MTLATFTDQQRDEIRTVVEALQKQGATNELNLPNEGIDDWCTWGASICNGFTFREVDYLIQLYSRGKDVGLEITFQNTETQAEYEVIVHAIDNNVTVSELPSDMTIEDVYIVLQSAIAVCQELNILN